MQIRLSFQQHVMSKEMDTWKKLRTGWNVRHLQVWLTCPVLPVGAKD